MGYQLTYDVLHEYDAGVPGIDLTVGLKVNGSETNLIAKLDTGASHCVFQRAFADDLHLEVEGGYARTFETATGLFVAYGHSVTLLVEDFDFDVLVYFAKDYTFRKNILGRNGFLNLVRVGLIDYEGKLFLSRYSY